MNTTHRSRLSFGSGALFGLLLVTLVCAIPFPSTVSPIARIRVQDINDGTLPGIRIYRSAFDAALSQGGNDVVATDESGDALFAKRRAWRTPFSRFAAARFLRADTSPSGTQFIVACPKGYVPDVWACGFHWDLETCRLCNESGDEAVFVQPAIFDKAANAELYITLQRLNEVNLSITLVAQTESKEASSDRGGSRDSAEASP